MEITSIEMALATVEEWRAKSVKVQGNLLQNAIESLELSQMYYEQKGNDAACERTGRCIEILRKRLAELSS